MRLLSVLLVISLFCCNGISTENTLEIIKPETSLIDTSGKFIITRFNCPDSFTRRSFDSSSFAFYLSHLKLKPWEAKVHLYDGTLKQNEAAYSAVVDMPISPKDLQQCADAVMRLRGEYLFKRKSYHEIAFRFLGDGKLHSYLDYAGSGRSYTKFIKYYGHNGEKKFLLAQSYMPAQETQILRQAGSESCWYSSKISGEIRTPEWTFDTTDLRRW